MGQVLSFFSDTLKSLAAQSTPSNVALIGLDAAGKTTMLYKLRLGERLETLPTIGFNVETVEYGSIKFTVWDLGGQEKIRQLWKHYFNNVDAVIFVVDSSDRERVEEAQDELWRVLGDSELRDICLLVFANKQDVDGAMTVAELTEKLRLQELRDREWYVQSCIATEGDGLYDGLDWLARTLQKKNDGAGAGA